MSTPTRAIVSSASTIYRPSAINILSTGTGLTLMPGGAGFWAGGHSGNIVHIEPGKARTTYPPDKFSDVTSLSRCSTGYPCRVPPTDWYKINVADRKVRLPNPVFEYRHLLSVPKCPGYLGLPPPTDCF
jgi:hypothetical protein